MLEGILLKGYSGFYYVKVGEKVWECSLRGRFRKSKQKFLPGDKVSITTLDEKRGVIESVLPKTNELLRPPIANVDQVIVAFAVKKPDPNFIFLDRILIMAHHENIFPVICFNKTDLLEKHEVESMVEPYKKAGYQVIITSTKTGGGIEDLRCALKDRISVFAGPSGAGKSSLLNAIEPGMNLQTGEVSSKIGRGKHTTRRVELLYLNFGGLVADTPGFSVLYLPSILREQLQEYFPEIHEKASECRFNSCLHHTEPDCAVKDAVEDGELSVQRYERYLSLLQEVIENERRY